MESRNYWEENGHAVKYEKFNSNDGFARAQGCREQLNFAAAPSDDDNDYAAGHYLKKGKVPRQDPMSHRIIEKRRRDRMNNCLADLSRLIPQEYLKKGRGRVEKTEIIEMAIRHIKYLQDRANGLYNAKGASDAAERSAAPEHYRAGYHEASANAVRFLVEVQGHGPNDGLCVQLAAHLKRHCPLNGEDEPRVLTDARRAGSADTGSSSSSSHGYAPMGVIARAVKAPEPYAEPYVMDSVSENVIILGDEDYALNEPLPSEDNRKREATLRTVRKPENAEDYLHSYKFKNSIERRFSRSQDSEAHDMSTRDADNTLLKRRRVAKPPCSSSGSNCGSTEDARDTSPQDTSSQSPQHHHHYEKPNPTQYVPVFALNELGKYYVPLSVDTSCLSHNLGPFDLDARAAGVTAPLHPVTIHVNYQPCLSYHVKQELKDRQWRAA